MTAYVLAAGLGSIAILSAIAVNALMKRADRKRVLTSLETNPCPTCARIYGTEIFSTTDEICYVWTLSRGNTISSMSLPRFTFAITCPHCQANVEYAEKTGRAFEHPQIGVIGFTRNVKSKATPSRNNPNPISHRANAQSKAARA